jgi:hypothetical protein
MSTEYADVRRAPPAALQVGVWAALLLACALLAAWDYNSFQLGTWGDDATYVIQARALLEPDLRAWLSTHLTLIAFPPGYPLFLAPLVALFPGNFLVLKLSSLVITLLCMTLLYWGWSWYAPGMSYRWAIAVTALYGLSSLTLEHTRMVMSEPLFALLCLLALLLVERAARGRARLGRDLLLGALLALSVLVRSVGLILVLTVLGYVALRRGRRCWPTLGLAAAGLIATMALVVGLTPVKLADIVPSRYLAASAMLSPATAAVGQPAVEAEGSEEAQVGLPDRLQVFLNVHVINGIKQRLGWDLDSLVFPLGGGSSEAKLAAALGMPWLPRATSYFVSALVIAGFAVCFLRRQATAFVVFGVTYLAVTLVWESNGGRLLYPIMAQLILAFLLSIDAVVRGLLALVRAPALARARVPLLMLVVLLLALLSLRKSLGMPDTRLHVCDLEARSTWLAANADGSDTLMSGAPAVDFAYSNLRTVGYPDGCPSPPELANYLTTNEVDFVLIAPRVRWEEQYTPVLSDHSQCMLKALAALQSERRAEQVYASLDSQLQVLRIQRDR